MKVDPGNYNKLGIKWNNATWIDTSIPFGYRHGSLCCQRVTDAIRYIMAKQGFFLSNYIDDLISVEYPDKAFKSFFYAIGLLNALGLPISYDKLEAPAPAMVCLGLNIDAHKGILSIAHSKIEDIYKECQAWMVKTHATKRQLQSLVGKLLYIYRLFVTRILNVLKHLPDKGYGKLPPGFYLDINWFIKFMLYYNGKTSIYHKPVSAMQSIQLDASLTGIGDVWAGLVYAHKLPPEILAIANITHLEMLNVLVALRVWGQHWSGSRVVIQCDNQAVVSVLNSGRTSDPLLAAYARSIWLICACLDIDLILIHIMGKNNIWADALSRWFVSSNNNDIARILKTRFIWSDINTDWLYPDFSI